MKKTLTWVLPAAALLVALAAPAAFAASYKVIVNESFSGAAVSKDELRAIFLGKSSRFENGQKAEPVDLPVASATRASFSDAVLGKSVSAVQSGWQRLVFSGKGVPPPEMGGDREVVSFVRRTVGGVGYVSDAAEAEGVKVVPVKD